MSFICLFIFLPETDVAMTRLWHSAQWQCIFTNANRQTLWTSTTVRVTPIQLISADRCLCRVRLHCLHCLVRLPAGMATCDIVDCKPVCVTCREDENGNGGHRHTIGWIVDSRSTWYDNVGYSVSEINSVGRSKCSMKTDDSCSLSLWTLHTDTQSPRCRCISWSLFTKRWPLMVGISPAVPVRLVDNVTLQAANRRQQQCAPTTAPA